MNVTLFEKFAVQILVLKAPTHVAATANEKREKSRSQATPIELLTCFCSATLL